MKHEFVCDKCFDGGEEITIGIIFSPTKCDRCNSPITDKQKIHPVRKTSLEDLKENLKIIETCGCHCHKNLALHIIACCAGYRTNIDDLKKAIESYDISK